MEFPESEYCTRRASSGVRSEAVFVQCSGQFGRQGGRASEVFEGRSCHYLFNRERVFEINILCCFSQNRISEIMFGVSRVSFRKYSVYYNMVFFIVKIRTMNEQF